MRTDEFIELVTLSHPGLQRTRNEDAVLGDPRLGLAVLADGMGGHPGGDVASGLAVQAVMAGLKFHRSENFGSERVLAVFQQANLAILERAQEEPALHGMGTTMVLAWVHDRKALIGHVGDSRAYLLRGRVLTQLTQDHSLIAMLQSGEFSPLVEGEPLIKGMLMRALGVAEELACDLTEVPLQHGDVLLLCSDGLHDVVPAYRLRELLVEGVKSDLAALAFRLVETANASGGPDNISVALLKYHAPDGAIAAAKYTY